jgi:hypothetical protein
MSESVKRKTAPDDRGDGRGRKRSKVCAGRSLTAPIALTLHLTRIWNSVNIRIKWNGDPYQITKRFSIQFNYIFGFDRVYSNNMQGGSGGKWQTPHQKSKAAMTQRRWNGKIEPGDVGIWATCVKGKEGAATEELKSLFDEVPITFLAEETLMM